MADSCIVCLGNLDEAAEAAPALQGPLSPSSNAKPSDSEEEKPVLDEINPADGPSIAHLLPCGHDFHDSCLRPWVERANSCPICRQNFNTVQLSDKVGGPVTSSYEVADRIQEADIDPTLIVDDFEEEESVPCPNCGRDDNEDVLLLCDGCESAHHTYCVGLDAVPAAAWYCASCTLIRSLPAVNEAPGPSPRRTRAQRSSERRTRGQLRRQRTQEDVSNSNWARVWQTVWDRLNIDLDFPFDTPSRQYPYWRGNRSTNRRDGIRAWERRLQVAERQGAANRFRDTAPAIFDRPTKSRPRPEPPRPESSEELLAWNALEKARDMQSTPAARPLKRKSRTSSPAESEGNSRKRARRSQTRSPSEMPAPTPERPLKRPNTRRAPGINIVTNGTNGESSRSRQRSITSTNANSPDGIGNAPTFLQSLLREVESSAVPDNPPNGHGNPGGDHATPRVVSPGPSPSSSNHPSPGAVSGTPPISPRSLSPVPLTSRVEPIYPPAPDMDSPPLPSLSKALRGRSSESTARVPRWVMHTTAEKENLDSRARSEEASPTRAAMTLSAKESVQKLVKEALREPYSQNLVNKDQYTEINRKVSRRLYELVGENGIADQEEDGPTWQVRAHEEVEKAISQLTNGATT